MIISIIHSAVARKILCNPINSLIAETEFVCAIGMACRIGKINSDKVDEICKQTILEKAKEEFLKYAKENEDPVFGKLLYMIKGYRLYDQKWTEELREILYYSYKNLIIYPKGKF